MILKVHESKHVHFFAIWNSANISNSQSQCCSYHFQN